MHFFPTQLLPIAGAQAMNPHVGLPLAFDRHDPDQHAQPLGVRPWAAAPPRLRELWEMGRAQKFQEVPAGLFDPLLRKHASRAAFQHTMSISASIDAALPYLALLRNAATPQNIVKLLHG